MIFYFTGTGNSLYVAEKLNNMLNEELISVTGMIKENRYEFDLDKSNYLGFVFPVYYYSVPSTLEKFIKKVEFKNLEGKKVFVFLTCGATTGSCAEEFSTILRRKGIDVEFRFAAAMPDNYILLYNIDDAEKQNKMIDLSKEEIQNSVDVLLKGNKGDYIKIKGPLPGVVTFFAHKAYNKLRKTKKFYSLDSCIDCKLCQEICPESAIKMVEGRPVWVKDKCTHCLACIHRCPVEAIQYSKKTISRRRYINPNVKL